MNPCLVYESNLWWKHMQDRCPSHRVSAAALLQQGVLRDGVLEIGLIVQFLHSLTGEYRGKLLAPAAQENQ